LHSRIGSKSAVRDMALLKSAAAAPVSTVNRPALKNIGTMRGSAICAVPSVRPEAVPPLPSEAWTPRM
jgi:hypothetical protein